MAQTYQNIRIFITLGVAAFATACSPVHETRTSSGSSGGSSTLSGGELSTSASAFSSSLYGELEVSCKECHGADDQNMPISDDIQRTHDFIDDFGYVNLATPGQSNMLTALTTPGHVSITPAQVTTIENAIQSWAIILDITGVDGPVGAAASLAAVRRTTFTPKCIGCHGGANPAAGLDFNDFALISQRIDTANPMASVLYQRITSDDPAVRMPRNADPLPQAEIDEILAWITAGGQNN